MIIDIFDTETTHIPLWKERSHAPVQPHLVQLAAVQLNDETREVVDSMDVIIRPDGWVSEPEALEVHGITTERAMDEGIPEAEAIAMFIQMNNRADMRVCYNHTFDARMVRIALARYFPEVADEWKTRQYTCAMQNARKVMGGKVPKLTEAYEFFAKKPMEDAHNAMSDVEATIVVHWGVVDSGIEYNIKNPAE